MVSHSHLSAGNSISSQSQDLFADYGISRPSSPSLSSPLVLSCEDMVESDANPQAVAISSGESTSSLNKELEVAVGPAMSAEAQDLFKAVHYFSSKDRDDALHERERNMKLLNFISAHGFSMSAVNAFVSEGTLSAPESARQVFDNIPNAVGEPSGAKPPSTSSPSLFGGQLVPVSCVGEASQPMRDLIPPILSPSPPIDGSVPSPILSGDRSSWSDVVAKNAASSSRSLSFFPPPYGRWTNYCKTTYGGAYSWKSEMGIKPSWVFSPLQSSL